VTGAGLTSQGVLAAMVISIAPQFVAAGKPEPNDLTKGIVAPVPKAAQDVLSRRIKEAFAAEMAIP
jgi:hypothetical protein